MSEDTRKKAIELRLQRNAENVARNARVSKAKIDRYAGGSVQRNEKWADEQTKKSKGGKSW